MSYNGFTLLKQLSSFCQWKRWELKTAVWGLREGRFGFDFCFAPVQLILRAVGKPHIGSPKKEDLFTLQQQLLGNLGSIQDHPALNLNQPVNMMLRIRLETFPDEPITGGGSGGWVGGLTSAAGCHSGSEGRGSSSAQLLMPCYPRSIHHGSLRVRYALSPKPPSSQHSSLSPVVLRC